MTKVRWLSLAVVIAGNLIFDANMTSIVAAELKLEEGFAEAVGEAVGSAVACGWGTQKEALEVIIAAHMPDLAGKGIGLSKNTSELVASAGCRFENDIERARLWTIWRLAANINRRIDQGSNLRR